MSPRSVIVVALTVCLLVPAIAAADADLNHDGKVDAADLRILIDGWHKYKAGQGEWGEADVNNDGVIDATDARLLLEAFIFGSVPTVQLAQYLPASDGDARGWQGDDGLIAALETVEPSGLQNNFVEDKTVSMFNDVLARKVWRVENGHLAALSGWFHGGILYQADPGVALPQKLILGEPVTLKFDVHALGQKVGEGSLTLTLEGANQTINVPAGSFEGCIRVRMQLHWTDWNNEYTDTTVLWLADGIGAVKRQQLGANNEATDLELAFAKVGNNTYGQRPNVNVAEDFSAPEGALFIWQGTEGLDGVRALAERNIGGEPATPLADLRLPFGSIATYWTTDDNGYIRGISGWHALDPDDYILSPIFTWRDTMPLGYLETGEGNVSHAGSPSYGTYSAACAIVGTNQSTTTPAGTFDGCHVYCVRLEAKRASGWIFRLRQRMWIKPGLGPVRIENYEVVNSSQLVGTSQGAPAYIGQLVFARNGNRQFGTQPTYDLAQGLKLAAGNCRRLRTANGDWQVISVAGKAQVAGYQAWEVVTAESGDQGLFDTLSSDFWAIQPDRLLFVGVHFDPDEVGTDVLFEAQQPAAFPRPLRMGDPVHFQFQLINAATHTVGMTITGDLLYSGTTAVNCQAGSFTGVHVVQFYSEMQKPGEQAERELNIQYYDNAAGLVQETTVENLGDQPSPTTWSAVWAKVGSQTWHHPGNFDIGVYYPLATGNAWRYGDPTDNFVHWEVGVQKTVGSYDKAWEIVRWEKETPDEKDYYYRVLWPSANLLVGLKPSDYPNTVLYRDAIRWPRPWQVGVVARTDTVLLDPNMPALSVPTREVAIPVAAGVTADTPAGRFTNCIRIVFFELFDLSSLGEEIEWLHRDMIFAPNVGPVVMLERDKGEDGYWGPGKLFWATVGGTEYGHQ